MKRLLLPLGMCLLLAAVGVVIALQPVHVDERRCGSSSFAVVGDDRATHECEERAVSGLVLGAVTSGLAGVGVVGTLAMSRRPEDMR